MEQQNNNVTFRKFSVISIVLSAFTITAVLSYCFCIFYLSHPLLPQEESQGGTLGFLALGFYLLQLVFFPIQLVWFLKIKEKYKRDRHLFIIYCIFLVCTLLVIPILFLSFGEDFSRSVFTF